MTKGFFVTDEKRKGKGWPERMSGGGGVYERPIENGTSCRSRIFAAKSSPLGCAQIKKTERIQTLRVRPDQEPCYNIPECVRQDVKTQSHRIHFNYRCSKYIFQLGRFHSHLLKYNGFQTTSRQRDFARSRFFCYFTA